MKILDQFDEVIRKVLPDVALRREKARFQLARISEITEKRGFEGASRAKRTAGWKAADTSANAEAASALSTLRARSRDLNRNDGYVKKGINGIVSNVVGTGIIAQIKGVSKQKTARENALWKTWAESTLCDFDEMHDLAGLQALCMRTVVEAGEVLIRKRVPKVARGEVALELQVLEPDFLDHLKVQPLDKAGVQIIQGVEYDRQGKRTAYWIFPAHPGNGGSTNLKSERVDASEIIHLFRVERAGQVRGIPWSAPIIMRTRDLDEYEDAELTRRKIAACFTAFVYDSEVPEEGSGTGQNAISDRFDPGIIEVLPPGKDIKFSTPPNVTGYSEYVVQALRRISAGLEVPYELLTGDYSQVNFSSGRMGWLEFQRSIDAWRWQMLVPRLCNGIFLWFKAVASLSAGGGISETSTIEWTAPRREMIDPVKETKALQAAVRCGFKTLSEAIREQGYDPEVVLAELKADNDKLDKNGLTLDSDPRRTGSNGKFQEVNGETAEEE